MLCNTLKSSSQQQEFILSKQDYEYRKAKEAEKKQSREKQDRRNQKRNWE